MTVDKLFRDINSRLNARSEQDELFFAGDVLNAINDGIREVILQAVAGRTASSITVSDVLTPQVNTNFINIYSAELSQPILQTGTIHTVIYNVEAQRYDFDITEQTQATINQFGIKPNDAYVYVCLNSYTGGVQDDVVDFHSLRNFALNDGGFYRAGQVIRHNSVYWKVLQDFDNNGIEVEEGSLFTQVYWMKVDKLKGIRPSIQNFKRIQSGALQPTDIPFVAFNKDTVYTSADVKKLYVEYVPEWVDADFGDTLDLPAEWEKSIKDAAIRSLAVKFGGLNINNDTGVNANDNN